MRKYTITEITDTWQGEGFYTGLPVKLIRFAGCNLSCPWCDESKNLTTQFVDLEEELRKDVFQNLLFTGGEPALQCDDHFVEMIDDYVSKAYECHTEPVILMETNATLPIPELFRCIAEIIASPKAGQDWLLFDDEHSRPPQLIKFVIPGGWTTPDDLYKETQGQIPYEWVRSGRVALQPQEGYERIFFSWLDRLQDLFNARLGISTQQHKTWAQWPGWRLQDGRG